MNSCVANNSNELLDIVYFNINVFQGDHLKLLYY